MDVYIDELSTDVRMDGDDASAAQGEATSPYDEALTQRMADVHAAAVRRRTSSGGFDD